MAAARPFGVGGNWGASFSGEVARVSIFAGRADGLFLAPAGGLVHVLRQAKRDVKLHNVRSQKRDARPRSRHATRVEAEIAIAGNLGALRLSTKKTVGYPLIPARTAWPDRHMHYWIGANIVDPQRRTAYAPRLRPSEIAPIDVRSGGAATSAEGFSVGCCSRFVFSQHVCRLVNTLLRSTSALPYSVALIWSAYRAAQ